LLLFAGNFKNNKQETNMGVAEKGSNALRKLKSVAQKGASSLPAGNLIHAVVDQVNQFETGIKQTVDGIQDKVKSLQANLLKMYQANKELELENRELTKAMVGLEKENAHLTMKLDRTQMELDVMKAKLENIGKLVSGYEESIAAVTRTAKPKRK
jgi:predicted nuclease with TOPRIM domain